LVYCIQVRFRTLALQLQTFGLNFDSGSLLVQSSGSSYVPGFDSCYYYLSSSLLGCSYDLIRLQLVYFSQNNNIMIDLLAVA